ncbi:hypothetical protein GCM10008090_01320 [Arenicella chitinivorans]|uniref:Hydrazine synthase alpha subunit middle domain-containing protein n=1 Tax=Arenicella chitinivorans TaxID=1329800 RepID=A0A918VHD4_9GAMM|nr:hypothetical protein [Arenicella chitinivorans]GGZ96815.1 hypothetical protein GCM10008090_01320 [Arenicella chitinivorans]
MRHSFRFFFVSLCSACLVFSVTAFADATRLVPIITYLLQDSRLVYPPAPESCPDSKIGVCYDIVYVRQPRFGDFQNTTWPEVFHPGRLDPGADLVLLRTNGTEEILIDCEVCSVTDPFVSFDGQWVFYSLFHDLTQLNSQRSDLPRLGADIYRINLASRQIEQLTHGEFTPNTGNGNWDERNPLDPASSFNRLGYGILNLGPMPLPGNKLVFTSNRNGFVPTKGFSTPTMQMFVMDLDGANVHAIAPMTIGSALHPTILNDGRIMFSSYESQGIRDRRLWGVWTIDPDGRNWAPFVSAMTSPNAYHFFTQVSSGEVVVEQYYNLNNNGFGALFALPASPPNPNQPAFGSPFPNLNPGILQTVNAAHGQTTFRDSFTPQGYYALTPMTHPGDSAAPEDPNGGPRVGKFTHPSAAPHNDLLVAWTPGPANDLNRPTTLPYYDSGLYVIDSMQPVNSPSELKLIKNDPRYNEAWPRAVVPWRDIHGVDEPASKPWLPNDGSVHAELPAGTAYGLVGSSSLYKRDTSPGRGSSQFDGLDAFNTSQNDQSSNWFWQGADAGKYTNSDIWAVRLLAMEAITDRRYGPNNSPSNLAGDFYSHANEKLRILGEIPVRKFDQSGQPIMDPEGNPDTSFLVKLPADTPFTFQTIDRYGMVLNMSQTWHQVRPGEQRSNCGGCHAHSQMPLDFEQTAASNSTYTVRDLSTSTPIVTGDNAGNVGLSEVPTATVNVEFYQDIRPILQNHCIACHNGSQNAGQLVLDDTSKESGTHVPNDYYRLANDSGAKYGYPPVIPNKSWRQSNASRYIRRFQSRRSLLTWKLFGARLDGWSNADHPTESVPGDASTLPAGTSANNADLDFVASTAHPAGGMTSLSMAQKMMVARWIDLGAPIDVSAANGRHLGWMADDNRPTLTISQPRANVNTVPVTAIVVAVADAYTGVDLDTFSVTADFSVNGFAAGSELKNLFSHQGGGVYRLTLASALPQNQHERHIFAEVKDNQGNVTRQAVRFFTAP